MSAADHLATYAEGWTKGDLDVILRATAEDYTLDDPNVGVIPKGALADYLSKTKRSDRRSLRRNPSTADAGAIGDADAGSRWCVDRLGVVEGCWHRLQR